MCNLYSITTSQAAIGALFRVMDRYVGNLPPMPRLCFPTTLCLHARFLNGGWKLMSIYDRPTKSLMADWAKANLKPNQVFSKSDVVPWFAQHYPKIKRNTVAMHLEAMSINNPVRKHHPSVKPGSGHDLFFKVGPDRYRLWNAESDGQPLYKADMEMGATVTPAGEEIEADADDAGSEFAYERDLQNYLAKNLHRIEPGLRLYEDDDISGLEFPAGGRYIDILAVDAQGS
jgi:hypothetical protein